jgi:CheY-like chemotaxis protein
MPNTYKILLVEDHDDDAYLFKRLLQNTPQFTLAWHAMHGTEAVAYLEGTGVYQDRAKYPFPDLMVLDLNMPRMDGFEVLKHMQGKFPKLKVGVFTTSDDSKDIQRALDLGAHIYQQKTNEPAKFIRFLEWLQKLPAVERRLEQALRDGQETRAESAALSAANKQLQEHQAALLSALDTTAAERKERRKQFQFPRGQAE